MIELKTYMIDVSLSLNNQEILGTNFKENIYMRIQFEPNNLDMISRDKDNIKSL